MSAAAMSLAAAMSRVLRVAAVAALCATALSCGGSPSGGVAPPPPPPPATANVATAVVDAGPEGNSSNTLFTSVTVCIPGSTTNCQTIDHIQVDTASFGLRILAPALTVSLPLQTATNGGTLAECTVFADGYSWGPIAQADLQISGESAASLPIQIIGDSRFPNVPADCSASGPTEEDTVADFGANGILGIGVFAQDCGPMCASQAVPAFYYACSNATACQVTLVPLADQVPNPLTFFATDNNGTIIDLPTVAAQGALTVTGSLIFGIDTQSNNQSGSETVLTVDPNYGYLTAQFNGQTFSQTFIDSGSNGNYFADSNLLKCSAAGLTNLYCPASIQNLMTTLMGVNGVSISVDFSVGNAQVMLGNNPTFAAFPQLAGTNPIPDSFDFGLAFFYGRRVATALESQTTSAGTGPYIAF